MTVTGFIAYAQGWGGLYIRANKLAWKLIDAAPGPRHQEPLRHSRLPRARALGRGVRARGRRAGRLRLRPGALLVADPPPHQLDGRRRLPAPRAPARSAATIPRATCCSSTGKVKRKFVEDGRHLVEIEQEAHNQDGEVSILGHRRRGTAQPDVAASEPNERAAGFVEGNKTHLSCAYRKSDPGWHRRSNAVALPG